MPGVCSHEFVWPRRAADGHYYQACRVCGAEYEFDWKSMRRVVGAPKTAFPLSSFAAGARLKTATRLNLLLELEPAYRVFFRNLAEILRPTRPIAITSRPAPFWRDVFVYSGIPWRRLGESMLCHVIAVATVLILSQTWGSQERYRQRRIFDKSYISYYRPSQSFPALRGSSPRVRTPFKKQPKSEHQGVLRVAPERTATAIKPPNIKMTSPVAPKLVASNLTLPVAPLSATRRSRLTVAAGPTWVVAPPPNVSQAMARRLGLPQASVIGPAREVGIVSSNRVITIPNASGVGPPPIVQASIRRVADINIGPSAVVAPSPLLPTEEQSSFSGIAKAALGSLIALAVPPPPSIQHSGALAGGRAGSPSIADLPVVPPPPSGQAVQNMGGTTARENLSAWSGANLQAVPPSPSLQTAGNIGGDQRASSLSSTGLQGVPPAPSVGDGADSQNGGRQVAMNIHPALGPVPAPIIDNQRKDNPRKPGNQQPREPATEELPVRVIGLALALPNSSYFSNYEVFIAEKRLRKDQSQLIKLVYVSLPYQRRLSDYGVDNSKVYKLRVSRDRTCDESLLQMTWPETDPHPDSVNSADSPALSPNDRKDTLPCYRTTADDYRRALLQEH